MTVDADTAAGAPDGRLADAAAAPTDGSVRDAVDLIAGSTRPLIVVGAGARESMAEITLLAEAIGAPVVTTFKAKGQISDSHPLGCGVLGRSGTPIASWFMYVSDAVIAFGASFSNHTGIASYKPIVQVDLDAMALGRFHPVDVAVRGDAALSADAFRAHLAERDTACIDLTDEIAERWAIWRAEKARRVADESVHGISSAAVMQALTATAPDDAVIAVDVGNNTYSFGRYFEAASQTVLMSGYLGSIGFALPAAMGAWAAVTARGDSRRVISVSGDGGFGQYAMELTTLAKYDMDITHVLLNNSELGKISKEQRAVEYDVWQTSLHNPNFAEFAQLCGVKAVRVTDADQLESAMADALAHRGPSLVEIVTDALLV